MLKEKIVSIDAETNGLWGNPFAIAAIVYENGKEIDKICYRLPDEVVTDEWVKENVLPTLNVDVTHKITLKDDEKQLISKCDFKKSYKQMLKDFADFYNNYREEATVLWHMGHIVESHLFRELHRLDLIGDWDAPYNPIEVAELLRQAGEKPDSVDSYIEKYDISVNKYGSTHNPLYDCEVAFKTYFHLSN